MCLIVSFARDIEPGARDQSQNGREMAQATDRRGSQDRAGDVQETDAPLDLMRFAAWTQMRVS